LPKALYDFIEKFIGVSKPLSSPIGLDEMIKWRVSSNSRRGWSNQPSLRRYCLTTVEKLATHNPTKDFALRGVFSAYQDKI